MKLSEIKTKLGINTLNLNTAKDAQGAPTMWMRHWEYDTRVAVSIHKELVTVLKGAPNVDTLGLQVEERTGSKGAYTSYRIVNFTGVTTPPETTL
jgi:hypothetical protein